jgi:glycosyltransferase involved in cell wall biosynthesis
MAHVRVLASSLAAVDEGATVRAFVVDDPAWSTSEQVAPGLTVGPPTMVEPGVARRLRVLCDTGTQLAKALTPWVADGLLQESGPPFAMVSPSTWFGTPLRNLIAPDAEMPALVPARLSLPAPASPCRGFNPSCVVVGAGADLFTRWWADRTLEGLLGLFDGSALDEAASGSPHTTLRDPGLGVDAWNATERDVCAGPSGLEVREGRPLCTFHFDDFDPARPFLAASNKRRRLPLLLSEQPVLRQLYSDYARALMTAGYDRAQRETYAWGHLPGGIALDLTARHAYRTALRAYRQESEAEPPNPFEPDGLRRFLDFLNEPAPEIAGVYSRYVWALYETWPQLPSVFPDVMATDRRHFVWWLNRFARSDGPVPSAIDLPPLPNPARAAVVPGAGVNVAGYLQADLGLAVSARRTIDALRSVGVQVQPVAYRRTMSRQTPGGHHDDAGLFGVNLVCVTAEQFPFFRADMGDEFFTTRYTIGYWYWELEEFPADQLGALDFVDEVWVATSHVRDALVSHTAKPVVHMPIPLLEPESSGRTRASFGLPDNYLFLFAFDFDSVPMRKNPMGVIAAFMKAFPTPGQAGLVLKSVNARRWPEEAEQVRCAVADRPDVILMDEYLSSVDQAALIAETDCFVSLHRAEGLGLSLADAMALGKPVIATRYSGNLDFMDDDNSFLVPFKYTAVPRGTPAYPAGAPWAEPDITAAARLMRQLVDDPELGRRVGAKARRDIVSKWTLEQTGRRMRGRLKEVWVRGQLSRA